MFFIEKHYKVIDIVQMLFFLVCGLHNSTYGITLTRTMHNEKYASVNECIAHEKAFLVGDVGGTNSRFGLYIWRDKKLELLCVYHINTEEIYDFVVVIKMLLHYSKLYYKLHIEDACFGAPGIVNGDKNYIKAGHVPFAIDVERLKIGTNLKKITILNDYEIIGYGLELLDEKNLITLHAGIPRTYGVKAIVGAGTGLGTCLMVWNEQIQSYFSIPSWGGGQDFAPQTEQEFMFMEFFKKNACLEKIKWGMILSGVTGYGITQIYEFLQMCTIYDTILPNLNAATIFENYNKNECAKDAVAWYMNIYARFINNLCHYAQPFGGIYICGGCAIKNQDLFEEDSFIKVALDLGQASFLQQMPVYLVTDQYVGLHGAAQYLVSLNS